MLCISRSNVFSIKEIITPIYNLCRGKFFLIASFFLIQGVHATAFHFKGNLFKDNFLMKEVRELNSSIDNAVNEPKDIRKNLLHSNSKVHYLFTHGRLGELFVNGDWLNTIQIVTFLQSIEKLKTHEVRCLIIYDCELTKGKKGLDSVAYLEDTLGIHINYSANDFMFIDGNWLLEIANSNISISVKKYNYNFQTCLIRNFSARHSI